MPGSIASIWLTAATPRQNHRNLPRLRAAMRYYGIPQVAHVRPPFTVPIARGPRIRSGVYGHPHSLRSSSLPLLGARGFPSCQDARGPKSVNDNVKLLAQQFIHP